MVCFDISICFLESVGIHKPIVFCFEKPIGKFVGFSVTECFKEPECFFITLGLSESNSVDECIFESLGLIESECFIVSIIVGFFIPKPIGIGISISILVAFG